MPGCEYVCMCVLWFSTPPKATLTAEWGVPRCSVGAGFDQSR